MDCMRRIEKVETGQVDVAIHRRLQFSHSRH